jgi:6-phosphogluconolactonase (cycloisomerase 2 family)
MMASHARQGNSRILLFFSLWIASCGGGSSQQPLVLNPSPTLSSVTPTSAVAAGAEFTITATGTNFISGSRVLWNGFARSTTFVSATQLKATILAGDILSAGTAQVTVVNPGPGGGLSSPQSFTINSPAPVLTSLLPSNATAGDAGFTVSATGTGFIVGSVLRWNGSDRPTQPVSATQLQATISASDIASAGVAQVTIFNPGPGGGTSAAVAYNVNSPVPVLTSLSPSLATAGAPAFTLTAVGARFVPNSVLRWNGTDRTTTFVSNSQLRAAITTADVAISGTAQVVVVSPAPGGGTSSTLSFNVNSPIPALSSLSPPSTPASGPAFTLTVNGSNFVSNSVVRWNGAARTTTFVSGTQLQAAISAADIATAGTAQITVVNPAPGGGISVGTPFSIVNPAPTLDPLNPARALVGDPAFTLAVTGSGFFAGSVLRWNGGSRPTTVVSPTQIQAAISAGDLAVAGVAQVAIFNPTPGGGTSAAQSFTVANPAPVLSSLAQTSALIGSSGFSLGLTGTGFVQTSVVRWNGANRPTTVVSSTQLQAAIATADLVAAGVNAVTVFTPTPEGGESSPISFSVNNPAPSITSITPSTAAAPSADVNLAVAGAGFVPGAPGVGSVVRWNGADRTTAFVDGNNLTATIPASDLTTPGTVAQVTVFTPGPGGGSSNGASFSVGPIPRFIYVANSDNTVSVLSVDSETGALRHRSYFTTYPNQPNGVPFAVSPDPSKPFVIIIDNTPSYPRVWAYSIDSSTGVWSGYDPCYVAFYCAGCSIDGGYSCPAPPSVIAIEPTANAAYVANSLSSTLIALTLSYSNGYVTFGGIDGGGIYPTNLNPTSAAIDKQGRFLYLASTVSADIIAFAIDRTPIPDGGGISGALAPVPGSPFSAPGTAAIAVGPAGNFLYSATRAAAGAVSIFRIAQSGANRGALISAGPSTPVGATTEGVSLAIDPFERFVYVTSADNSNVSAFRITPATFDGGPSVALTPVTGSPFAVGARPLSVAIDPSGRFAYVANHGGNNLTMFQIDQTTGALSPAPGARIRSRVQPFYLAATGGDLPVDTSPHFAYVANSGSNDVTSYRVGASGGLSQIDNPVDTGGLSPGSLALSPLGDTLWVLNQVANQGSPSLSIRNIDPTTGTPSQYYSSASVGVQPTSVTVEGSGRFSYVTTADDGGIVTAYEGNSRLGDPLPTGSSPAAVAVDPTGRFAYVANSGSNNISSFAINPIDFPVDGGTIYHGQLLSLPAPTPAGTAPVAVVVHPSGKFTYAVNHGSKTVSLYLISAVVDAGTLTPGPSVNTGTGPSAMAFAPSGRFAYVVNHDDATVQPYTVDLVNGTLTPVAGAAVPTGTDPASIAVDPSSSFVYVVNHISENVSIYGIDPRTGALGPLSVASAGSLPAAVGVQ